MKWLLSKLGFISLVEAYARYSTQLTQVQDKHDRLLEENKAQAELLLQSVSPSHFDKVCGEYQDIAHVLNQKYGVLKESLDKIVFNRDLYVYDVGALECYPAVNRSADKILKELILAMDQAEKVEEQLLAKSPEEYNEVTENWQLSTISSDISAEENKVPKRKPQDRDSFLVGTTQSSLLSRPDNLPPLI